MQKSDNKLNAFKHGAYIAEDSNLWGEDYEDYDALIEGLFVEWQPNGPIEEFEVHTLAKLIWTRRRIDRYLREKMQMRATRQRVRNEGSHLLEKLKLSCTDFLNARDPIAVMKVLSKLDPPSRQTVLVSWPLEKCEQPHRWGPTICEGLRKCEPEERHEGADGFVMIADFVTDHELNLIDRSDASIQRKIKHLVQLKAAKQMLHQLEPRAISKKVVEV